MAILKPYTFVAGTKAKASEVNADFDTLYTEVNSLDSGLTQVVADVETLDTTKANINGNTANRFSVANPVNSYDAVNKQYLFNSIGNSLPYINGLGLAIDSTDTIHVDAGSCYDSELTTLMVLSTSVSKQNTEQSASTTYYVYLIATDGGTTDILISTSSSSPALPTGYTKYRRIGYYKTNSDNGIDYVASELSESIISSSVNQILALIGPDYAHGVSKSAGTDYQAETAGWLVVRGYASGGRGSSLFVGIDSTYTNNPIVADVHSNEGTQTGNFMLAFVPQGYYYREVSNADSNTFKFYPCKGGN